MSHPATEIALALDLPGRREAEDFLNRLDPRPDWIKIGLQLFCREGPEWVRRIADQGHRVFLDLKLHDIPNTVAAAIESLGACGASLLTVHASGGRAMLETAVQARDALSSAAPRLLAVTVLTHLDDADLNEAGFRNGTATTVVALGQLALDTGIDGLVCSPRELSVLRERFGTTPLLVTPGIRPADTDRDEQKRAMTPAEAAASGSSIIVVGRPILRARNPSATIAAIRSELAAAG